ncbi:MAG: hypothetical protein QG608_1012 [Actinomycetota bacterium]|nr:hypothetical protein [Actinomycetota bacterium]
MLVGRSTEWVSSIECGRREVRRLDVLTRTASALRVTLPDLVGAPVLAETEPEQDDVPAVRDALMTPQCLSRVLYADDPATGASGAALGAAGRYCEHVWGGYQAGAIGSVLAALPGLLGTARELERGDSVDGWKTSARVHHLAATTLSKIGESDLAWLAAERAVRAAEASGDPLSLASAARAATHALLANGRYDDALGLGDRAAGWLAGNCPSDDPEAASLAGMLHLRAAVAAARHNDRSTAAGLLDRADAAARIVGRDTNLWRTAFGPTNVAVHRIAVATDLGDLLFVCEHGPRIDARALPVERQAALLIDVGRAQAMLGRDEPALASLLEVESIAPQLVRHATTVRESVRGMYRRAGHTGASTPLMRFAERCRAAS